MLDNRNLRTVDQLAEECPVVTKGQLRWWIFNAEQNGLAVALIRIGGRVFIDVDAFNEWLEKGRQGSANQR